MGLEKPPSIPDALEPSVLRKFRKKLLGNYTSWCSYLGKRSNVVVTGRNNNDLRRELLYVGLYLLIWGEARNIVEPIRSIVRKKNVGVSFLEAQCFKIDAENKKVYCRPNQDIASNGLEEFIVDYDYLVIAMGARPNTFNTPGVEEHCKFLKEVEDAQEIRRSVIDSFERASLPSLSDEERKRILHFVVVGGRPTGVEFTAELHDFVNEDLIKLYPMVKDLVKISLLEAAGHILGMFDKRITAFAEEKFKRDGIDVKLGSMVYLFEWEFVWITEHVESLACDASLSASVDTVQENFMFSFKICSIICYWRSFILNFLK